MVAFHNNVTVPTTGAAVPLSSGTVAAIRVLNPAAHDIWIQATTANIAPTSRAGALRLMPGETLAADLALSNLFPGLGAGPYYLWGMADAHLAHAGIAGVTVSVSHA